MTPKNDNDAYTFHMLVAQRPAALINAPGDAKLSDLGITPGSQWRETRQEITIPVSDVRAILHVAKATKGQPLEPVEGKTGSVFVVPQNAQSMIIRRSAPPVFVSASIAKVFSGENEGVDLGLVKLMFGASHAVRPLEEEVTPEKLKAILANQNEAVPDSAPAASAAPKRIDVRIIETPAKVVPIVRVPRRVAPPTYIPEEVSSYDIMSRRKAIKRAALLAGGALAAGGLLALLKSTELPKLTAQEKQDLIDQVDVQINNPKSAGMQFYNAGGDTFYYDGDDLKSHRDEVIKNIRDDFFRAADVYDIPDQNPGPRDPMAPQNAPLPQDDMTPPDVKPGNKGSANSERKPHQESSLSRSRPALSRRALFARFAPQQKRLG